MKTACPQTLLATALVGLLVLASVSPAGAEYARLSADVSLYYEQAGNGPQTIVFIPGWTASSKMFERQLKHFAGSSRFRAISYDPRGQGLSTKTWEGHTYQQHGRDLAAFMEKLGLTNVVLVGWSYGVFEMLAYVNQSGITNLKAVVVIDGAPRGLGKDNTKEWVWASYEDKDKFRETSTLLTLQDRPRMNLEFGKWMLEAATPENLRWVDNIASQTPNAIAALLNETGMYCNYEPDLKALHGKLPLLLVVREDWRQVVSDWAKANAPTAEVVVLGKHLMFWERSQEFNATLDRFLDGLK